MRREAKEEEYEYENVSWMILVFKISKEVYEF
jgi:hypothetical protein